MSGYLLRRILGAIFVIWGVSTAIFLILQVAGDPVEMLLSPEASDADATQLRAQLGLDDPIPIQYLRFLTGIVTLDFGESYRYGEPALEVVLERFPVSLLLTSAALGLALLLAIPLSIVAAANQGKLLDRAISSFSFLGQAVPVFWLGVMMIIVFGVKLGLLPTFGAGGLDHLVLPAVTLSVYPMAQFIRLTRSELLDVLRQDYIRTATAKGLFRRRVLLGHAFSNASIPLITMVGLNFGILLSGAVITETIFAWPGVGRLTLQAISTRDLPVIQAGVATIATAFVLINLFVDIAVTWLDPRIRVT
ncbi:MAG: ABC transporter permease [Trueperaceae bacterium]